MRNRLHIAIFFTALTAACVPNLSHGQATGPAIDLFKLYFTDDVVHKCAAKYPATAETLIGSFERMKRRNGSYLSAGDWERIRRGNEEIAIRQKERDGYINEIIGVRSCALVIEQLSVGGELDQSIFKNFRKIHGR